MDTLRYTRVCTTSVAVLGMYHQCSRAGYVTPEVHHGGYVTPEVHHGGYVPPGYVPPYVPGYIPPYAPWVYPTILPHPVPAAEYTPLTWAGREEALGSTRRLITEIRRREASLLLRVWTIEERWCAELLRSSGWKRQKDWIAGG